MRKSLFLKLFLILILIGVVPTIFFYFLAVSTYQPILEKYSFYIESVSPEILQETVLTYKRINIQIGWTLAIIVALVSLVSIFIAQTIVSPIKKLVKATRAVARGELKPEIKIKTGDEIEDLANSFNKMLKELSKTQTTLEDSAKVLEIKIKARTEELEMERLSLEDKVKQRTKELEERLEELERIHRLTVGRELKMIELKEEIQNLKEKAIEEKNISRKKGKRKNKK